MAPIRSLSFSSKVNLKIVYKLWYFIILGYQTFFEDKIALPNGQGNVSAYFYEIFTQLWVENEMMLDVARLIREYPDFNIWVVLMFPLYKKNWF